MDNKVEYIKKVLLGFDLKKKLRELINDSDLDFVSFAVAKNRITQRFENLKHEVDFNYSFEELPNRDPWHNNVEFNVHVTTVLDDEICLFVKVLTIL